MLEHQVRRRSKKTPQQIEIEGRHNRERMQMRTAQEVRSDLKSLKEWLETSLLPTIKATRFVVPISQSLAEPPSVSVSPKKSREKETD